MNYYVGQVLYLLMHKEHSVIPVQVTEKILRTTLEGNNVSYIVELPTKNKDLRKLDGIDGSVYEDTNQIKIAMLEKATATIDSIIQKAEKASGRFTPHENPEHVSSEETQPEPEANFTEEKSQSLDVDLGGGVVGKISIESIEEGVKNAGYTT